MSVLPRSEDKPRFVAAMFGRIARRYDLMNTLMTAGQDAVWRRRVAARLVAPSSVLDVGTGTGKLAQRIHDAWPGTRVTAVDFSVPMLRAGRTQVPLAAADAQQLPFASDSFDGVTSAFLIRNLADAERGLGEQVRVLRPRGILVILETTPGPGGVLGFLFQVYFQRVVPLLGKLIAGDAQAYTYLPQSSAAFSAPERLATSLARQGLVDVEIQRLNFGSVAIVSARKP